MAFDLLVLILIALNICAKSRKEQAALTNALFKDGVLYFLVSRCPVFSEIYVDHTCCFQILACPYKCCHFTQFPFWTFFRSACCKFVFDTILSLLFSGGLVCSLYVFIISIQPNQLDSTSWPLSAIILSRFILRARKADRTNASLPSGRQLTSEDDDCHTEEEDLPPLAFRVTRRHSETIRRDSAVEMWEIEEARSVQSHDKLVL